MFESKWAPRKIRNFPAAIAMTVLLSLSLAGATTTMSWTNPSNGEKLIVGVNGVDAIVTSSVSVHVVQLYMDGIKQTEQVNDTTTAYLDKTFTIAAAGSHSVTVQALDNSNNVLVKVTRTITAVSSAGGVYSNIDNVSTNWIPCNQCGGGGGGNPVPASNLHITGDDGNSIQFTTAGETGVGGPFGTSYWYDDWAASVPAQAIPPTQVRYVKLDFFINVPAGTNANSIQAIEFETQQRQAPAVGKIWNMAWQADYKGSGHWRTFNYVAGTWNDTGIAISATPAINDGNWHHVIAEFHVDGTSVYDDALTIDGTRFAPHQNYIYGPKTTTSFNQMTNAFQLDMMSANVGVTAYLDRVNITYTNQ